MTATGNERAVARGEGCVMATIDEIRESRKDGYWGSPVDAYEAIEAEEHVDTLLTIVTALEQEIFLQTVRRDNHHAMSREYRELDIVVKILERVMNGGQP